MGLRRACRWRPSASHSHWQYQADAQRDPEPHDISGAMAGAGLHTRRKTISRRFRVCRPPAEARREWIGEKPPGPTGGWARMEQDSGVRTEDSG